MKHHDIEGQTTCARILRDSKANPEYYSADFAQWAADNKAIVETFATKAWQVIQRGREHYSARTIIEVIRHESALAEAGSCAAGWKINNNRAPDLARAFMRATGVDLFETRGR